MEETLGKRISANRKRIAMTQDRMAEALGVTAQAVSKWENDQSCPDIAMLPKLASLFGTSVDALLGLAEPSKALAGEIVESTDAITESETTPPKHGHWEFRWDGGRKPKIWFAVWVLLMGVLLLWKYTHYSYIITLWDMVWPSALMLFGLSGLYPRFSFFRLGCALFGGYSLLEHMQITHMRLHNDLILIIALLLFGVSLLVDALRKPEKSNFVIRHNGKTHTGMTAACTLGEDSFDYNVSFHEDTQKIDLPLLRSGQVCVSFGEATLDLSGCDAVTPDCHISANCSFGELTIQVPKCYRVELNHDASFASIDISGQPDAAPAGIIHLDADASFGEIEIVYI